MPIDLSDVLWTMFRSHKSNIKYGYPDTFSYSIIFKDYIGRDSLQNGSFYTNIFNSIEGLIYILYLLFNYMMIVQFL